MDLVKRLEEYRDRERELMWEGNFAQYFEIVCKKTESGRLSHERIYHMIMDAGVETTRTGDLRYNFFTQEIFGIEKPLQQIVEYFHSAAQRLEVRKRILLLMGPVGGGKSSIVYLLKRGLEAFTRAGRWRRGILAAVLGAVVLGGAFALWHWFGGSSLPPASSTRRSLSSTGSLSPSSRLGDLVCYWGSSVYLTKFLMIRAGVYVLL